MSSPAFSPSFPYRIEKIVGEGGMGVVYRGWDPDLQRPVAIKVLKAAALAGETPQIRRDTRLRFLQEARAAAALSHPGITTIYRIGDDDGNPYIAMEWLAGKTLEAILAHHAPLSVGEAARLGVELCDALDAAHRAGVVHRDVKPSNLVVLDDGRVKVTDFGIARIEGSELVKTREGSVLATPLYASPEQLRGEPVDARSDLFSAGVVLYLCFTGHRPFTGRTMTELMASVLAAVPLPLRLHVPEIPEGVEAAVLRALAREPAGRYERAAQLAEALRPFAAPAVEAFAPQAAASATSAASGTPSPTVAPFAIQDSIDRSTLLDEEPVPSLTGLPSDPRRMVGAVVASWPARRLERQAVAPLLDRLLEAPLHAEPFSGGVLVGESTILLLHQGWILAAVDLAREKQGDEVAESLPAEAAIALHAVPAALGAPVVPLLAALLGPRTVKHKDLDSSFVNLPALARKLHAESFHGAIFLRRGASTGAILLDHGRTALALFSEGWNEVPLERPWQSWVSEVAVHASVEEPRWAPLSCAYRRVLKDALLEVEAIEDDAGAASTSRTPSHALSRRLGSSASLGTTSVRFTAVGRPSVLSGAPGGMSLEEARESDFATRLLRWALVDLPVLFAQRGKTEKWKYLAGWLPLVKKAALHHSLPRPSSQEKDLFDLVTFDAEGKVLHLGHRLACGSPAAFEMVVERMKVAKDARSKRGDVGGAFIVSPSFDPETAEAYRAATKREEGSRWFFSAEEAATGYEGFLRMGPRRGFHVLLVVETESGFEPVIP